MASDVPDDAVVWRRVPLDPMHVVLDENEGRLRPSSAAFEDPPDGSSMSVTLSAGQSPEVALEGLANFVLVGLRVGFLRELGLEVIHRPLPENEHHYEVAGPKKHKVRSKIAKAAQWVIPPPDEWPR